MNDPGHGQASRHATCEGNPRMSAASSLCPLLVLLIVCDRCGVRCEVWRRRVSHVVQSASAPLDDVINPHLRSEQCRVGAVRLV